MRRIAQFVSEQAIAAVLSCVFLLAGLVASPAALAQTYLDRNVTIVVTSAPGALTDTLTRAIAQRLSEMWKESVIVENRGGAGYTIATQYVTRARMTATRCSLRRPASHPTASLWHRPAGLRRGEGLRPGRRLRHHSDSAAGESVAAGQFGERPDRARQEEARGLDLRHGRNRHCTARRRARTGESRRHRHNGGALSRLGTRAD